MNNDVKKIINIEFYILCCLCLSLPIMETPKHIFSVAYLCVFIVRIIRCKETLQHSPLAKYITALIIGSLIASIGSSLNGYETHKLHDILRYCAIALIISYGCFSRRQAYAIIACLAISLLVGIAEAYYSIQINSKESFKLRSVGHINHTAIYILLIIGSTLPLLIQKAHNIKRYIYCICIIALFIFVLIDTNSRATAIGLAIIISTTIIGFALQDKNKFFILTTITGLLIGYATIKPPQILSKFQYYSNVYTAGKLTPRERIWNTAYYAWKKEPWFGVGYGNYSVVTEEKMKTWYEGTDIEADISNKQKFLYYSHSHNRYLNTLAEGGTVGLLGLLVFLLGSSYLFIKEIHHINGQRDKTLFWLIGCNTLLTVSVIGLFNTTLHHEHGLLAMILLALSYQQIKNSDEEDET